MEVKVTVDGIPRVVCGVTEETTCQEVVVALAQALGQPGRYMLREKFKDFERCMTPSERILETLKKYGEQAKEVQLTLLLGGACFWDEMSRGKIGRHQPCPPLRRKDAGVKMRPGSGLRLSLNRQSLPPLPCLQQEAEKPKQDPKRPKRKSLTLVEEAWEWLENMGKGKVYSTAWEKENSKRRDKSSCVAVSLIVDEESLGGSSRRKVRGQKSLKSDLDQQTSCCMGSQARGKESKHCKKAQPDDACGSSEDEKNSLKETIISQLGCLQDLQVQIACMDKQILELEEKQRARRAEQEAQERTVAQEMEQIQLWENELKGEENYEKELQCQFLEMKSKCAECKAKLEEYKHQIQGLDSFPAPDVVEEDSAIIPKDGAKAGAEVSTESAYQERSVPDGNGNVDRKSPPEDDFSSPCALVSPNQIRARRPTGPAELREWWTRWSEAQNNPLQKKKKVIHRSELTIYLASTKV